MMDFTETLVEMCDEAEEDGIDFGKERVELNFTLDEKPGIVFTVTMESEASFDEIDDYRNLH